MAKKKYVKPIMVSEEFVPNEYVAACEVQVGTIFDGTLDCEDENKNPINVKIVITSTNTTSGTLQGTPVGNTGSEGTYETIYIAKNGEYVYGGSVSTGHNNSTKSGEYMAAGGYADPTQGIKLCNHVLNSPALHHHYASLTITNKNHS